MQCCETGARFGEQQTCAGPVGLPQAHSAAQRLHRAPALLFAQSGVTRFLRKELSSFGHRVARSLRPVFHKLQGCFAQGTALAIYCPATKDGSSVTLLSLMTQLESFPCIAINTASCLHCCTGRRR